MNPQHVPADYGHPPYHGPPDEGESGPGLVLSKLEAANVPEAGLVLAHLLTDDQFHTPAAPRTIQS